MKNRLNVLINIFFPIWIILTIALLLGCLAPLVDRYFSKPHWSDEAMSLSLAAVTLLQKLSWRGTGSRRLLRLLKASRRRMKKPRSLFFPNFGQPQITLDWIAPFIELFPELRRQAVSRCGSLKTEKGEQK